LALWSGLPAQQEGPNAYQDRLLRDHEPLASGAKKPIGEDQVQCCGVDSFEDEYVAPLLCDLVKYGIEGMWLPLKIGDASASAIS
jgi:hypothetical protein